MRSFIIFQILLLIFFHRPLSASDRSELAITVAHFDFLKQAEESVEGRLEYRFIDSERPMNPFAGVMMNSDGARYVYAGMMIDLPLWHVVFITPSFAPGFYYGGKSKNLYFGLEFRSQLEISLRYKNDVKMGFSLNHVSNAGMGPPNPGVESLAFSIVFPVYKIF